MEKFTAESLVDGKLRLFQPEKGYRYTLDSLILCAHIHPPPNTRILDIGCGCGIMPLILGHHHPATRITGVEVQASLAGLAQKNIIENQMSPRIDILNKDIATLSRSGTNGPFDQIISNPPYKRTNTGRPNPHLEKAIARHEIKLTVQGLFTKAAELLSPDGRITIIFPAERLFDAYRAMAPTSIRPERVRFIHLSAQKNAMRVIVSAVNNFKSSCRFLPPLYLYDSHGTPTKEHRTIINA